MATSEIQEFLAEFCEGQAEHRDRKAEAYPEDTRNATSAEILREFADWVRGLPSARVDLAQLEALTAPWEPSDGYMAFAGDEANRVVSRIGFSWPAPFEDYLAAILTAVESDVVARIDVDD